MVPAAELPFRITTGILLAAAYGVRLWFQRRTGPRERLSASHVRRERGFYLIVLLSYLLAFVYAASPRLDRAHLTVPIWLRWSGAGAMAGAIALLWWTHATLGRNWSGILEIYRDHALVTAGPYRRVRHPMYLGFFVFGVGMLALTANAIAGGVYLASVTWMYVVRVPAEEEMMISHFGEIYLAYMDRTGRLLPRVRMRADARAGTPT
jgi:protein-S-isoprenylcysteine O-methyltransferase Ste14